MDTAIKTVGDALATIAMSYGPRTLSEYRASCASVARNLRQAADRSRRQAEGYGADSILRDLCLRDAAKDDASAAEYEDLASGKSPAPARFATEGR